ncbi:MAG: hypothetical protein FJ026_12390, partial [Chloroflexi bacterium]|nr:hypothetical protein [Chloroflexota bacterium]
MKDSRPTTGFLIIVALALVFYFVVPNLPNMNIGDSYVALTDRIAAGDLIAKVQWGLGDWSDAQFHKTWLSGLLVILGAVFAAELQKRRHPLTGFGASYGSGLFYKILAAEVIADAISVALYARLIGGAGGWFPTFIPVCSFAGGAVLMYGGGWPTILTVGILGGVIGGPGAAFINKYLATPFGLPVAIGNVGIMILGAMVFHSVFEFMPWMKAGQAKMKEEAAAAAKTAAPLPKPAANDTVLFVKRVFADFTECCFFGSDWAGAGLVVGSLIMAIMNADSVSYGTRQLGTILCVQLLASGLGLWLYWHKFKQLGWIATFVSMVGVSPAMVLVFGASFPVVLVAALVGGIFGAPIAFWVSSRLPEWGPGYTGA